MGSQPNHSLIDGLACLQALAASPESVGCRELGRSLDLDPMRANRLLKTLADIGLAQQDEKKRYRIGPGIHALAAQSMFASGILQKALPLLRTIKHKGFTVAIGSLWREHVTYLFHGKVGADLEQGIGRMGLYPASRSSVGMQLMAQHDDAYIEHYFSTYYNDDESKKDFFKRIRLIRKQGFAVVPSDQPTSHLSIAVTLDHDAGLALALAGVKPDVDHMPYVEELQAIAKEMT